MQKKSATDSIDENNTRIKIFAKPEKGYSKALNERIMPNNAKGNREGCPMI